MIRLIALSFGTVTMVGAVLWGLDDRNSSGFGPVNEVSRSEPAPLSLQPAVMPRGVVLTEPVRAAPATNNTPVSAAAIAAVLRAETAAMARIRPVARPAHVGPQTAAATPAQRVIPAIAGVRLAPAAQTPSQAPVQAPIQALGTVLPDTKAAPQEQPKVALAPSSRTVKDDAVTNMMYGIIGAFQAQDAPAAPKAETQPAPQPLARIRALADEQTATIAVPEPVMRTYQVKEGDSLPGIAFRFYGTTVAYLDIINANTDLLASPGDLRAGMTLRLPEGN